MSQGTEPIISEFGYVLNFAVNLNAAHSFALKHDCPKGARILSRQVQRGFKRDVFLAIPYAKMASEVCEGETFELITVGVPRDPQQFIAAAVELGHPRFLLARLEPQASESVNHLLGDTRDVTLLRTGFLKKWMHRAKELQAKEEALHRSLPDHLQQVLAGKRLLLWREILSELEYQDVKIIDEILHGLPMTGWVNESAFFSRTSDLRR